MGIAKVDIDVVNLPPKTKNNEKLDSSIRKHKNQYNFKNITK